jgi:hypothetical protein
MAGVTWNREKAIAVTQTKKAGKQPAFYLVSLPEVNWGKRFPFPECTTRSGFFPEAG